LEISIDGGAFTDFLVAGGGFVTNGYNQAISSYYNNPLAGREAWSGDSGGFITTMADLPVNSAGRNIQLRWRFGSDNSYGIAGWYVDNVLVSESGYTCLRSLMSPRMFDLRLVSPDSIAFSYDGLSGQIYYIETATSLTSTDWMTLQTNNGDGSRVSFTNSTQGSKDRYFRLRTR